MAPYLPSEISRIVYGYLRNDCSEDVAGRFLNTCPSMKECRIRFQSGFDSKFQNQFSLTQILDQYSTLSELVFKNESTRKSSHINIVHSLQKLLKSRIASLTKKYAKSMTCTNVIELKSTNTTNIHSRENTVTEERSIETAVAELNVNEERVLDNTSKIINVLSYCEAQSHCTPVKQKKSSSEIEKFSFKVPETPMWNHSVQRILMERFPSPVKNMNSSTCEKRTPIRKRNYEETLQEITDECIKSCGKRRKLNTIENEVQKKDNQPPSTEEVIAKNCNALDLLTNEDLRNVLNDFPVTREIDDEILLYYKISENCKT